MQMLTDSALVLFWLKKFVSIMLLPPLGPMLMIAAGLVLMRRWRRGGLALAWLGLTLALLLALPVTVGWMLRDLERAPVVSTAAMREAQAIVILGAGKRRHAPEYGGETVNRLALERLRYGARLAHKTGLPVLVSGGAPTGEQPEADLMRSALADDFGVAVRWVEGDSLDTQQNARFSAARLRADGVQRVLLVTHAAHMPRAQTAFEAEGLTVIPAPTAWLGGADTGDHVPGLNDLPGASSAYAGWYAAHEWLGLLAYRLMH